MGLGVIIERVKSNVVARWKALGTDGNGTPVSQLRLHVDVAHRAPERMGRRVFTDGSPLVLADGEAVLRLLGDQPGRSPFGERLFFWFVSARWVRRK